MMGDGHSFTASTSRTVLVMLVGTGVDVTVYNMFVLVIFSDFGFVSGLLPASRHV